MRSVGVQHRDYKITFTNDIRQTLVKLSEVINTKQKPRYKCVKSSSKEVLVCLGVPWGQKLFKVLAPRHGPNYLSDILGGIG
jgi:hypothetical protein